MIGWRGWFHDCGWLPWTVSSDLYLGGKKDVSTYTYECLPSDTEHVFFFFPFLFLVLLDLHSPGSDASSDGAFRIISQSINTKIHFSRVKNFIFFIFIVYIIFNI
jgi:hypothetical protein